MDATGTTIAERYELFERVGEGASGEVYRARDRLHGVEVAVKLIRNEQPKVINKVRREVASLKHLPIPGVVRYLDDGHEDDVFYLVMEFVEGSEFPGLPRPVPWPTLAPLATRLLEVLARVHSEGVLHRDLKPANVRVTPDGRVVLLDFGLARGAGDDASLSNSCDLVGTLRYISAEQLEIGSVDARSDLYSVGLMLFEALAGRIPQNDRDMLSLVRERTGRDPLPITNWCGELPERGAALVDALVRRRASDRPRSAAEALRMLADDPSAPPRATRMPRLGGDAKLEAALAAVRAGGSVDVAGVAGSGRTRLLRDAATVLEREGRTVRWAVPGQASFESVAHLVDVPPGTQEIHEAVAERLAAAVGVDGVLFADDFDQLDPHSREAVTRARSRIAVVRVQEQREAIRLEPLDELALRDLFCGPDRVVHLREDAARQLYTRTSGLPRRVASEVTGWVDAGLATWDGGRLRIAREAIDRLAGGLRAGMPLPPAPAQQLVHERPLRDLLGWIALAGPNARPAVLAAATRNEEWRVLFELDGLEQLGAVQIAEDGSAHVVSDPGDVAEWSESRRKSAHAAVARALPAGTPGRLAHLLNAHDLRAAAEECRAAGARADDAGEAGLAYSIYQIGLGLARQVGQDPTPHLVQLAVVVADLDSAPLLEAVAYEARRAPAGPVVRAIGAILQAQRAAFSGDLQHAESVARALGPLSEPRLEIERIALIVRAGVALNPAAAGLLLADLEPLAAAWPLFRPRWQRMVGHLLRTVGQSRAAAEWHLRSGEGEAGPRNRRGALYNACVCFLDAFDLDAAERAARELIPVARRTGAPAFELRAESILRDIALRRGERLAPDFELVEAAGLIQSAADSLVYLQEAIAAWRSGHPEAAALARRARDTGKLRNALAAHVGGEVLARLAGDAPACDDAALVAAIHKLATPRLQLQFIALYAQTLPVAAAGGLLAEAVHLRASLPVRVRGAPLELYSPDAAVAAIAAHLAGRPAKSTSTPNTGSTGSPKA